MLVAIVGATGTGKSELALDLADALPVDGRAAEIVNADAMQLYRGMDIGTAKVPESETARHPASPPRRARPERRGQRRPRTSSTRARRSTTVIARGAVPILVGGSGLYVSSVLYDFRFPGTDPAVRERLEAELAATGPGILHRRLAEVDPTAAAAIGPLNGRRLVRALEVIELTGEPFGAGVPAESRLWRPSGHDRTADGPRRPRRSARLARSHDVADGLVDEVDGLLPAGFGVTASRAIGYAQAIAQLRRRTDRDRGDGADRRADPPICAAPGGLVRPVPRDPLARRDSR